MIVTSKNFISDYNRYLALVDKKRKIYIRNGKNAYVITPVSVEEETEEYADPVNKLTAQTIRDIAEAKQQFKNGESTILRTSMDITNFVNTL